MIILITVLLNKVIIMEEFQNSVRINISKFSFLFLNSCRYYPVLAFTGSIEYFRQQILTGHNFHYSQSSIAEGY